MACFPRSLARDNTGISRAARIAIMAMITWRTISVKAFFVSAAAGVLIAAYRIFCENARLWWVVVGVAPTRTAPAQRFSGCFIQKLSWGRVCSQVRLNYQLPSANLPPVLIDPSTFLLPPSHAAAIAKKVWRSCRRAYMPK